MVKHVVLTYTTFQVFTFHNLSWRYRMWVKMMKRKREEKNECMDIVWQTPANPPLPQDYIFRNGKYQIFQSFHTFRYQVRNWICIIKHDPHFFPFRLMEFMQGFDSLDHTTSNSSLMLVRFANFSIVLKSHLFC